MENSTFQLVFDIAAGLLIIVQAAQLDGLRKRVSYLELRLLWQDRNAPKS